MLTNARFWYMILTTERSVSDKKKGYYAHEMGDQEYLDRQDDYSIVIFLEHKEGPEEYYIAARIYINGWQIVLMNPDLY